MSQKSPLKIAIYSPYLDTAGGGEKYMLTIAEVLSQESDVELLLDHHLATLNMDKILAQIGLFHGLNLTQVKLIIAPIGKNSSMVERLKFLRKYDVLICNTDGSIFPSSAKRSYIHFQVPFTNTNAKGVLGKLKLKTWKGAIYNSNFTKDIIEKTWGIKGVVIYPPVSIELFKPKNKKTQILSVGRFFSLDKSKKQSLMIKIFQDLVKEADLKKWSLHLVGGMDEGNKEYVEQLKKLSRGSNIYFHPNLPLKDLQQLYGESMLYWHAKGYGESDPKDFEHFGITTVEAMAAGCVPLAINLGGQREIIKNGVSGYLWNTIDELKDNTLRLIKDNKLREEIAKASQERSKEFSKKHFEEKIKKLVYS